VFQTVGACHTGKGNSRELSGQNSAYMLNQLPVAHYRQK
jgi:hypothetical protein